MYKPTRSISDGLSCSAVIPSEYLYLFEQQKDSAREFESALTRTRANTFAEKNSVLDCVTEAENLVGGQIRESTKEEIIQLSNGRWMNIYNDVLYKDMDWMNAMDRRLGDELSNFTHFSWSTDELTWKGESVVELPMIGEPATVYLDADLRKYTDQFDKFVIQFFTDKQKATMKSLAEIEVNSIEASLTTSYPFPKKYTDPQPSGQSEADASLIETFEDPFENTDELKMLFSVLNNNGNFTDDRFTMLAQYMSGVLNTGILPYSAYSPTLTWEVINAVADYTAYIPQEDIVLFDTEPLDEFSYFENEFPEKQHLTDAEKVEIFETVGYPTPIASFMVKQEATLTGLETMARMWSENELSPEDVSKYMLCQLEPYDRESAHTVIEFGSLTQDALRRLDNQLELNAGEQIINRVEERKKLHWD